LGADTSSEAIDDRDVDEGLARGVSDGEMFVEGADDAGVDSAVSKRRRGAVSDGSAVVVAMAICWGTPSRKEGVEGVLKRLGRRTSMSLERGAPTVRVEEAFELDNVKVKLVKRLSDVPWSPTEL
jgi:hypothetical protein